MPRTESPSNRSSERSTPSEVQKRPTEDILQYLRDYAREKPEAAALWCFSIGFILGWKLKPW